MIPAWDAQWHLRSPIHEPLLGVPDWWPDNGNATFYENARHFRPAPDQTAAI